MKFTDIRKQALRFMKKSPEIVALSRPVSDESIHSVNVTDIIDMILLKNRKIFYHFIPFFLFLKQ